MQYFILPFVLLIYFELLGRYIYYKLNKEASDFSFLLGFVFTMALLYITSWPITAFNGNFYYLTALYLVLFLISLILIIKDIKHLSFKINCKFHIFPSFFLLKLIINYGLYFSYYQSQKSIFHITVHLEILMALILYITLIPQLLILVIKNLIHYILILVPILILMFNGLLMFSNHIIISQLSLSM